MGRCHRYSTRSIPFRFVHEAMTQTITRRGQQRPPPGPLSFLNYSSLAPLHNTFGHGLAQEHSGHDFQAIPIGRAQRRDGPSPFSFVPVPRLRRAGSQAPALSRGEGATTSRYVKQRWQRLLWRTKIGEGRLPYRIDCSKVHSTACAQG